MGRRWRIPNAAGRRRTWPAAVAAVMRAAAMRGRPGYGVKSASTAAAVVGNVGANSANYTAVGEMRTSSRVSSVPGDYGCRIVAGPATQRRSGSLVLNELTGSKSAGGGRADRGLRTVAAGEATDAATFAYPARYHAAPNAIAPVICRSKNAGAAT